MIVWPRGQKLHELGTPCPEYPGKFPEYPGCYNPSMGVDDIEELLEKEDSQSRET